jgi:diacylglycerol kinase family enzyme
VNGPFCLIVNPAAGGGKALRLVSTVTAALDEAGAAYLVSQSASLDSARISRMPRHGAGMWW